MAGDQEIVGQSPPMRKVLELIEHVAKTEATVLILGESGTGKELVARAIHVAGKRRYAPLVAVNCGGLPESLLESELFGHEKGAFTGADEPRKGKIEMADGGTLLLDEVGAINAKMQVDLLRVLETHEVFRVGADRPRKVDFRVVCATNDNLAQAIREGRFREDFYYRINVFTIELPPLHRPPRRHSRPGAALPRPLFPADGQPHHRDFARGHGTADEPGLAGQCPRTFQRHRTGHGGRPATGNPARRPAREAGAGFCAPVQSLDEVEKQHIAAVLASTDGNVKRAAEILQVDRVTVYKKIKKYGLRG